MNSNKKFNILTPSQQQLSLSPTSPSSNFNSPTLAVPSSSNYKIPRLNTIELVNASEQLTDNINGPININNLLHTPNASENVTNEIDYLDILLDFKELQKSYLEEKRLVSIKADQITSISFAAALLSGFGSTILAQVIIPDVFII